VDLPRAVNRIVVSLRRVPTRISHPYLVLGPENERLGLVGEPVLVAKLLAGDSKATCSNGPAWGLVYLADLDSWLTLYRPPSSSGLPAQRLDLPPRTFPYGSVIFRTRLCTAGILRKLGAGDSVTPKHVRYLDASGLYQGGPGERQALAVNNGAVRVNRPKES